jgi:hypothetical protein
MAKIKIDDLAKTGEIDAEEQRAVQGGGLKKLRKKAQSIVNKDTATSAGITALQGAATAGTAIDHAIDTAGDTAETVGDGAEDVAIFVHNH